MFQMHRLEVVDVPGIRYFHLQSLVVSHFNEKIALADSSYTKLKKLKRSMSNIVEKNGNAFLVHHTEKHKERRIHCVKDFSKASLDERRRS